MSTNRDGATPATSARSWPRATPSSGWSSRACSSSPPPSSSAPSTSSAADGVASGEPRGGELRVARAAGREVAPHECHTLDGEPPELASLAGQQGVGQRRIAPRDAHTAEGHMRRERARLALEPEPGERGVHTTRELHQRVGPAPHARPDHARACRRWVCAEPGDVRLERGEPRRRPGERHDELRRQRLADPAQEPEREVEVLGSDPGDVASHAAQPLDGGAERGPDRLIESNRHERPDLVDRVGSRAGAADCGGRSGARDPSPSRSPRAGPRARRRGPPGARGSARGSRARGRRAPTRPAVPWPPPASRAHLSQAPPRKRAPGAEPASAQAPEWRGPPPAAGGGPREKGRVAPAPGGGGGGARGGPPPDGGGP